MKQLQEPPRLKKLFEQTLRPQLFKNGSFGNMLEVPRFEKIVLNMGLGKHAQDQRQLTAAQEQLTLIAGQRPVPTKARKSIAGFKIREGMTIGFRVTLRGVMMYEFLDRLITIALPRIRDFRGLSSKSFDGKGNYSFGIREHVIFPEVDYDKVDQVLGMDIAFVTTGKIDSHAKLLLEGFGIPFMKH
ncbi:MAG: 50S ribosomal protein L5 [Alphaproteobacteria bacterium]